MTHYCFTCDRPTSNAKYCSMNCFRKGAARRFAPRFWKRVDKDSSLNGCWLWVGQVDHHGYGSFAVATGRSSGAHRVSWELANGPIAAGLDVCHRCDNPPCVNPAHLFLGTHQDNMRDAERKGRLVFAKHLNKLSDGQKQDIQQSYKRGDANAFAQRYGVSRQTIHRIVYGYPAARRAARRNVELVPHVNLPVIGEVS